MQAYEVMNKRAGKNISFLARPIDVPFCCFTYGGLEASTKLERLLAALHSDKLRGFTTLVCPRPINEEC